MVFSSDTPPPRPERDTYPIRATLPGVEGAYTENWPTYWLLSLWESQAVDISGHLSDFYNRHVNPVTCDAANLDWVAQLAGYTGVYWDVLWPENIKRTLIAEAYTRVWPQHGTAGLLRWLFELFELGAELRAGGSPFRTDSSFTDQDTLGGGLARVDVFLPNGASRDDWDLTKRLMVLFSPIWVPFTLSYQSFRTDISRTEQVLNS